MSAQKGLIMLLKVGSVASGPVTVASLQTTTITLANTMVDITNKDSNGYRTLLAGAGEQSIAITATGIADTASAQASLRNNALNNTISIYTMYFEDGDTLECLFQITKFEVSGVYNKEQTFTCTLESSGTWTFTEN